MKPQSNLKEASIRTRRVARAGLQLVRKFREQLDLGDTECAGGRIVRRAQCDHRPHKAPIGIVELRGAAPQCGQCVLERLRARGDRFRLSTRSRPRPPRPIPLDFVISNPLNFWRPRGPLSPKGQEQLSHCREIGLALAGVDAPRPCGPLPSSRRGALRFDLSQGDTITNKSRPVYPGLPAFDTGETVAEQSPSALSRRM